MMCECCGKNPATVHVKEVINGVVRERRICSYCAAKEGYSDFNKLSLTSMLASLLGDVTVGSSIGDKRCECCGCSFADIAQSGKVGCSECYITFKNELLPSLNRLHGKALHVGSTPISANNTESLENKIADLKSRLADAVSKEEFEKAAELRDEIKALEGEKH